jgi:hypothetical protein
VKPLVCHFFERSAVRKVSAAVCSIRLTIVRCINNVIIFQKRVLCSFDKLAQIRLCKDFFPEASICAS